MFVLETKHAPIHTTAPHRQSGLQRPTRSLRLMLTPNAHMLVLSFAVPAAE